MISLWIDKGRIGTRLEIMKNSVDRRLRERDQERAEVAKLSDERVREGVLLVAAAATLSQTQIIGVPDGTDSTKGISPKAVLIDWTDAEIAGMGERGQDRVRNSADTELQRAAVGDQACGMGGNPTRDVIERR